MIGDITTSLEANYSPINNLHKCDVEIWHLQRTYTENGLLSDTREL